MAEQMKSLEEVLQELSPELRQQVYDFATGLAAQQNSQPPTGRFKFDWEGGLADLADEFTSVELQHDILKHWDEDVSA